MHRELFGAIDVQPLMRHCVMLFLSVALLVSCDKTPPAAPTVDAPREPDALESIEMREIVHLARVESHITITPTGRLRCVRTDNKSFGPRDIDPARERTETREGQLTADQIARLRASFSGWESIPFNPPVGVPDAADLTLRCGDTTFFGSDPPDRVAATRRLLLELSSLMPIVPQ